MRIVIDTNVLISGLFFGGKPYKVLRAVINDEIEAAITDEIEYEYRRIVDEALRKFKVTKAKASLENCLCKLTRIDSVSDIKICRDPDDDKFINCAIDSKALYIVSGDKDLLTLKNVKDVDIITAAEFCDRYL